jgi:hypothetical protein
MVVIDVGILCKEVRRMAGIDGILHGLEDELNKKLKTQAELSTAQAELVTDIDALQNMIAVGRERRTEDVSHEEPASCGEEDASAPVRLVNPFKAGTIRAHVFEVMQGTAGYTRVEDIWKAVKQSRRCSLSTVSNILYENTAYFQRGDPGYFLFVAH